MSINLRPGERIKRTKLHEEYGGRRQGGISPSRQTGNVFFITAERGKEYGYIYDGWGSDGHFHYTGEGRVGDQQMVQGNRAISEHEDGDDPRELHGFLAHGTELEYMGQFRYHDHYFADAPAIDCPIDRKVIVFRLEQLSGVQIGPTRSRLDRLGQELVKEVPIEQYLTERTLVEGDREPYEVERNEHRLIRRLVEDLELQGHDVCRLQFRPPGEPAPLYCDVFDKTTNTLYEAKGTVTRAAMRMAIGQLADYARLVDPAPSRVILMPEQPRADLVSLASSQGIDVAWPAETGFASSMNGIGRNNAIR